ncbi:MAG TPA: hypothetical protein PK595_06155 [Bacteroidota bacterium]|nr:hypothetical protein [Bacteroidota bacterium]
MLIYKKSGFEAAFKTKPGELFQLPCAAPGPPVVLFTGTPQDGIPKYKTGSKKANSALMEIIDSTMSATQASLSFSLTNGNKCC